MKSERALALFFAFFLFINLSSAYWSENLRVRAVDLNGYPIAGAGVTVKYQKNVYFGPGAGGAGESFGGAGTEGQPVQEIKRVNYESLYDGRIDGKTDQSGIYDIFLQDFVPFENETRFYVITLTTPFGSEKRSTSYGAGFAGGRHLEEFVSAVSLARVPVRVVDKKDRPIAGAVINASCAVGAVYIADADGFAYMHGQPGSSCDASARFNAYNSSAPVKFLKETIVVLNMTKAGGGRFVLRATDEGGRQLNYSQLAVAVNQQPVALNQSGGAELSGVENDVAPATVDYLGRSAAKSVRFGNYAARVVFQNNPLLVIKIFDFNVTLTVLVVDENGNALGNASVRLGTGERKVTGEDGRVVFKGIQAPSVNMSVVYRTFNATQQVIFSSDSQEARMQVHTNPLVVQASSVTHAYEPKCRITVVAYVRDPRVNATDNKVYLEYNFNDEKELGSVEMAVGANGTTQPASVDCPKPPAMFNYRLSARNRYSNTTTALALYTVPEPREKKGGGAGIEDVAAKPAGSESTTLLLITLAVLAIIIIVSFASLTALLHRKGREAGEQMREEDEPQPTGELTGEERKQVEDITGGAAGRKKPEPKEEPKQTKGDDGIIEKPADEGDSKKVDEGKG